MSIKSFSASLIKMLLVSLFVVIGGSLFAQLTVSGTVTSEKDGTTLAGVAVLVKGTTVGAYTDQDGNFSVRVPEENASLVFSILGYESLDFELNGRTSVSVTLTESFSTLDEVVVVGYGTVKQKDVTGSVAKVSSKDFNQGVLVSPDQLIQGKVAGLQVVNSSGAPGANTAIRIRGAASIRANNRPLVVVDGIPLDGRTVKPEFTVPGGVGNTPAINPLAFLNPGDIASIEVLKDASAAAIYGSRGANGVILVTTRKGRNGRPQINFSASAGVSNILNRIDVLDGNEYRDALNQYGLTTGDNGGNVDALDEILRTAVTQNYYFAVRGGDNHGTYRISAGYQDIEGIIQGTGLTKYNVSFTGNYGFFDNDRVKVDMGFIYNGTQQEEEAVSNDAGFRGSLVGMALQWNPTTPLTQSDGSFTFLSNDIVNPLHMLDAYDDVTNISNLLFQISPSIEIVNGLTYRFNLGINEQQGERDASIQSSLPLQDIEGRGVALSAVENLNSLVLNHTLNYDVDFGNESNFNVVAGYEYFRVQRDGFSMFAQDFLVDELNYSDIFGNSSQQSRGITSFADPTFELQSFFGRANINLNDKYLLTATVRADGSSKFGENNQYGVFPSFAAAWNLHNEGFLPSSVDLFKLRVGWGQVGNQEFPAGAAQERYNLGQGTIALTNVANPDLRWETSSIINIGLDFSLLDYRINGTIAWFNKVTTDLLYQRDAIQPAPATQLWENLNGELVNAGVELLLNTYIVSTDNVTWQFGTTFSWLTNSLSGLTVPPIETGGINGQGLSGVRAQRIANDQPFYIFFLRQYEGLDANGQSVFKASEEGTPEVLEFNGNPTPDVLLGINTSLTVGKLNLSLNFQGAFGHQVYNNTANAILVIGNLGSRNISPELLSQTDINGNPVQEAQSNAIKASTRYMEDADYLRLANTTLSYDFGSIFNGRVQNVRVNLTGVNLFLLTNYSGFDPEVNTDKNIDGVPSFGIEYTPYPTSRTILAGIDFTF